MKNYIFLFVCLTGTISSCTADTFKRIGYDTLSQRECTNQSKPNIKDQCNRSYNDEYDDYQRERATYLKETEGKVQN